MGPSEGSSFSFLVLHRMDNFEAATCRVATAVMTPRTSASPSFVAITGRIGTHQLRRPYRAPLTLDGQSSTALGQRSVLRTASLSPDRAPQFH